MRIGAVSMNSSVNRALSAIKKISAIAKPRTFAVEEVSDQYWQMLDKLILIAVAITHPKTVQTP